MILKFLYLIFSLNSIAFALDTSLSQQELPKTVSAPKEVSDTVMQKRLQHIFAASGWLPDLKVKVREGLVFLSGKVHTEAKKDWAIKIIGKTEGVVGIVDDIEDSQMSVGLSPVQNEFSQIRQKAERLSPYLLSAIALLVFFILISYVTKRGLKLFLNSRNVTPLIATAISNLAGLLFIIFGFYFALKISGLSTLAVTVLGGTGFLGIGMGLALKGVFENFSASVMISVREVFRKGEWVKIGNHDGVVHSVTTSGTTLMDFDGNIIVIPNSYVFNSVIENYTRNPKMRTQFTIGVAIKESVCAVRKTLLDSLVRIDGVLQDPEAYAVVSDVSTTNYKITIFFWFNAVVHSRTKIRSAVIEACMEAIKNMGYEIETDSLNVTLVRKRYPQSEEHRYEKTNKNDRHPPHNTNSDLNQLKNLANYSQPIDKEKNLLDKK